MTTRLEDQLRALGADATPAARSDFVADLEDRLRGLDVPVGERPRRRMPARGLTAAVAAGVLALLGLGLLATPDEREVRTLSPVSSSTAQPPAEDKSTGDMPSARRDERSAPPTSKQAAADGGAPSEEPPASAPSDPAHLRVAAFQHHTRVMVMWERYAQDDFAFYEVRRADDRRPGHTVIARIRDVEEHGTADQLHDPNTAVRYQVVVVSRDGSEVAVSDWVTPEQRDERASEPRPVVTVP